MHTEVNAHRSTRAYWLCQATGWGLYSGLRLYAATAYLHLPWARVVADLLWLDGSALALTHGLRFFIRRRRWGALAVGHLAPRILGASVLLALPLGLLTRWSSVSGLQDAGSLSQGLAVPLSASATASIQLALQILNWAIVMALWLIIYFVATGIRQRSAAQLRESELARALQLAELRLLKTQLNPHFLFNSLNTVRSLIADDPARATRAVTHLANTLRYTLSAGRGELVTLAQELDIVRDYLALESMRFEDRLEVEYDVAPNTAAVQIPVMLLQTVVENSIKHGISELPDGGRIKISARLEGALFSLLVENPRPPVAAATMPAGIGLRNADERLRLLFGVAAGVVLDLSHPSVATARIHIPLPS
jgi:LytS/YehU family sensor histidine kinase